MTVIVRPASAEDASLLVQVIDMASGGVVPKLWDQMAPPGMDGAAVGLGLVGSEDGDFSYRNGFVAEHGGKQAGGLIGYALPKEPHPAGPDTPEAFVVVEELANCVPGHWYINVMAVVPEGRRQGVGASLLAEAEVQAGSLACPGLALIVAASNGKAISVYQRAGYVERERRPFDLTAFGEDPTEAVLMVKALG